jgi:hypothetical protein
MTPQVNQQKLTTEEQLAVEALITRTAQEKGMTREQAAHWLLKQIDN